MLVCYHEEPVHLLRGTSLTFQSLAITVRTIGFNIQKFYIVLTLRLRVLYGSHNKQRLLPYTALAYIFFHNRGGECLLSGSHRVLT
jgi:hypothetical protein